jgi:molybdenum cofactor sulfurtransferase
MKDRLLHLDRAASPPVPPQILDAWTSDVKSHTYSNPHSSSSTSAKIFAIRSRILAFFDLTSSTHTVIFTSNASSACRLVATSIDWSMLDFAYLRDSSHHSIVGIKLFFDNIKVFVER